MMMRDHHGREWVTITQAAQRWGIQPDTLRKWRLRGKVRSHRTRDGIWLLAADVAAAEHATRGRYAAQRSRRRECPTLGPGRGMPAERQDR